MVLLRFGCSIYKNLSSDENFSNNTGQIQRQNIIPEPPPPKKKPQQNTHKVTIDAPPPPPPRAHNPAWCATWLPGNHIN